MPRATPVNSFKSIVEEIGKKPSPKAWEEFGIPENTPYKQAVVLRLYHAIIEEKAYHLLPKLMTWIEPPEQHVDIEITDWRTQFSQLGIPMDVLAERLRQALEPQVIDVTRVALEAGLRPEGDAESPRSIEQYTGERPDYESSAPRTQEGEGAGQILLDADAETETPD